MLLLYSLLHFISLASLLEKNPNQSLKKLGLCNAYLPVSNMHIRVHHRKPLTQGSSNYGPWARYGPPGSSIRPRYLQTPPPPPRGGWGETKQPQMTACHCIRAPAPWLKSLRTPALPKERKKIVLKKANIFGAVLVSN